MSKRKHSVNANSFKIKDSSVFQSGNFSAKHTTKNGNNNNPDKGNDKLINTINERNRSIVNDVIGEDETVQPLTITGGFHNTPTSEFNDANQLGVSFKNSSHRESLLSSSLSQSLASSKFQRTIGNNNNNNNNNTTNNNNNDKQSQSSNMPLWGENSPYDRSIRLQQKTSQQQQPQPPQQQSFEPAGTNYSSMKLPGGFISREIEPWINDKKTDKEDSNLTNEPLRRVASSGSINTTSHSIRSSFNSNNNGSPDLEAIGSIRELTTPGAFRRNYLLNKKTNNIKESDLKTKNFIEFLELYGHFAGQDLEEEETETENETDEEFDEDQLNNHEITSNSLIRNLNNLKKSKKTNKIKNHKEISNVKAFLLLLKAFLGTGIIFLPKAFSNGGLIFSNLMIIAFSVISYYCFSILIKTTSKCKVSGYGDVGFKLFGKLMQFIILLSLSLSQLGFSSTYVVFVCKNFQAILNILIKENYSIGIFIIIQIIIFIPISLTRNISKLSICALIADIFIFIGIIYIYFESSNNLINKGISNKIEMFQINTWPLFIGTAVFAYEGIGLLIPIQESMKDKNQFNNLLMIVMIIVTIIFCSIASLSYLSFGDDVHTIIFMDFNINLINILIRIMYSISILLSTPIQLFPAIKIIENYLFNKNRKTWKDKIRRNSEAISILNDETVNNNNNNNLTPTTTYESIPNINLINQDGLISGKSDLSIKIYKNLLRIVIVLFMCGIGYLGSSKLDKFVSLIGSITCVPLIYVYPPMLYYQSFKNEIIGIEKFISMVVLVTGCIVMVYTTYDTIINW